MKDLQLDDGGVPAEDRINRTVSWRGFLRLAAVAAGGSVAALACGVEATLVAPTAIPAMATPPPAEPQAGVRVAENDPRIQAGPVEFQGNGDSLKGYLSRPTGPGPHPAVLVIHENRGLLPHFSDVTRRLAVEGYAALAINMLSREGGTGTFASTDAARDALRKIARDQIVGDAAHICRPRTLSAGSGWESWGSALAEALPGCWPSAIRRYGRRFPSTAAPRLWKKCPI